MSTSSSQPANENPYAPPEPSAGFNEPVEPAPKEKSTGGFLRHAAIYGLGAIAVQMASVVLLPLYVRWLTAEEFGVLQILYRVGDVLNICLMVGGINLAAMNFWCKAETDEERKHVPASIACLTTSVILIGGIVLALSSGTIATRLDLYKLYDNAGMLLAAGVVAMMLQATTVMPLALMQARVESTKYLIASVSLAVFQLSAVAISLVVFNAGVWGVVMALAITFGVFGIGLTVRELSMTSAIPDKKILIGVLKFALPFVPSGVFFFFLSSGDQFFINEYCGAAVLGAYALAYRISKSVVTFSSQPLMQVWNARMYEANKQEDRSLTFGQMYTRVLAAYLFVGVGVILFLDEALMVLGTFTGTRAYVAPLVFAHFFLAFSFLMDSVFYVEQRTDLKPWILAASAAVIMLAYWILIPIYQGVGGAYATLIGFAFHWALTTIVAQKLVYVRVEWLRIGVILAVSVAITLAGGLIADKTIAKAVLYIAVLVGFWFSGFVTDDEKEKLRSLVANGLQKIGLAAPDSGQTLN